MNSVKVNIESVNLIQREMAKPMLRLVVKLREVDGKTFQEIGDILGVSKQRAHNLYQKAMKYKTQNWL